MRWQDEALCLGASQRGAPLWWSSKKADKEDAKAICGICPVKEQCLAEARREKATGVIRGGHEF